MNKTQENKFKEGGPSFQFYRKYKNRNFKAPITQTTNFNALSSHICIEGVSHELVANASKIGFMLPAKALKIVNITKDLTMFVAMSPIKPVRGRIRVQIYIAIVIGIRPTGLLRASRISSSTFESVLSASFESELRITEIINPLHKSAINITSREEIIDPRSMPKKPLFQTSLIKLKKFSIFNQSFLFYVYLYH